MINENMEKLSDEKEEQIAREYHEEGWDDQTPQVESAEEKPENRASEAQRAEESVEVHDSKFREKMLDFIERTGGADAREDVKAAQAESEEIKKEVESAERGGQMSEEEIQELHGTESIKDFEAEAGRYAEGLSNEQGLPDEEYAKMHEAILSRPAETPYEEQLQSEAEPSRSKEKSAQEIGSERLDKVMGFAKKFLRKGAALLAPDVMAKNAYKAVKDTAIRGGKNLAVLGFSAAEAGDKVVDRIWMRSVQNLNREISENEDMLRGFEKLPPEKREREHVKNMMERLENQRVNLEMQKQKKMKFLAGMSISRTMLAKLKTN